MDETDVLNQEITDIGETDVLNQELPLQRDWVTALVLQNEATLRPLTNDEYLQSWNYAINLKVISAIH